MAEHSVCATVRRFDPTSRRTEVFDDHGGVIVVDPAAFDAGGLRLLRVGQRVRVAVDDAGTAVRITIPGVD